MLNAKAFANAATAVTAVFYVLCFVISYIAPDVVVGIANSWMHTLSLESLKTSATVSIATALYGLLTISFITWVSAYAVIVLYNRWSRT